MSCCCYGELLELQRGRDADDLVQVRTEAEHLRKRRVPTHGAEPFLRAACDLCCGCSSHVELKTHAGVLISGLLSYVGKPNLCSIFILMAVMLLQNLVCQVNILCFIDLSSSSIVVDCQVTLFSCSKLLMELFTFFQQLLFNSVGELGWQSSLGCIGGQIPHMLFLC